MVDGNFTADHLRQKRADDDVWLMEGQSMMTSRFPYHDHLNVAKDFRVVRDVFLISVSCTDAYHIINSAILVTTASKQWSKQMQCTALLKTAQGLLVMHAADMAVMCQAALLIYKRENVRQMSIGLSVKH